MILLLCYGKIQNVRLIYSYWVVIVMLRLTSAILKSIYFFQITVPVTKTFIEYIKHQPMVFEVFGHYQQQAMHKITLQDQALNAQVGLLCFIC